MLRKHTFMLEIQIANWKLVHKITQITENIIARKKLKHQEITKLLLLEICYNINLQGILNLAAPMLRNTNYQKNYVWSCECMSNWATEWYGV